MGLFSEYDTFSLLNPRPPVSDKAPLACRLFGHKWPKALKGDYYEPVRRPAPWTVRAHCDRPGCPYIREVDLAGVNPDILIPWSEPKNFSQSEREIEREAVLAKAPTRPLYAKRSCPNGGNCAVHAGDYGQGSCEGCLEEAERGAKGTDHQKAGL